MLIKLPEFFAKYGRSCSQDQLLIAALTSGLIFRNWTLDVYINTVNYDSEASASVEYVRAQLLDASN